MEKTLIQAGKISNSFAARRWRLWEWINGKIDRRLTTRKPATISSLQELWTKSISKELVDGDYISLTKKDGMNEGWYMSEWVPKAPGQTWLESSLFDLTPENIASGFRSPLSKFYSLPEKIRNCFINNQLIINSHWEHQYSGQYSLAKQGFGHKLGVYRPEISTSNDDNYALLSICSGKEYMIDLAFPVIVSKQVYRKFLESAKLENSVEVEGVIRIREVRASNAFNNYLKTAGSGSDEPFHDLIANPLSIPSIVGEIISPLDLSTKTNGSHPLMTLRVDGFNVDEDSKENTPAISRFIVTNPTQKDFQRLSPGPDRDKRRFGLDFLLGDDHQFGTIMSPATDFDGRIRHYHCEYPVKDNPLHEKKI